MTQKIIPHLWFDDKAEEAANFYVSLFKNSTLGSISRYGEAGKEVHGREPGSVMTVEFELSGQKFIALNGGPIFTFNPSISFHVKCATVEEVDALWAKLSEGSKVLMELGEYPFSKRYGWLQDRYGLSWQVIFTGDEIKQKFTPALLFVGEQCGRAEEAVNFYTSVFKSEPGSILARYSEGEEPDKEGTVKYASFSLAGQEFGAMDSAHDHKFSFNEAISFMVECKDQAEIDYYWDKLSAVPESEMCGWLKDKFGVSWQIVPAILGELMADPAKSEKVMAAFLQMKKMDIAALEKAGEA